MPLATALRSIAESNARHWPIDVVVLHDGMSDGARRRVAESLPHGACHIDWKRVELGDFAPFGVLGHISRMTYARLLLPTLLPPDVPRALYLDVDILVLKDLNALRQVDLHGAVVGAVSDLWVRGDAEGGSSNVPRVGAYFNAGVLLIDLARWRAERVSERALDYLRRHPSTPYSDQDALNVACDGRWTPIEPRWNFQGHLHVRIDRLPAAQRPAIVHFITRWKPWLPSSASHNAALYRSFRNQTAYQRSRLERLWDMLCQFGFRVRYRVERWFSGPLQPSERPKASEPARA